MFSNLNWNTRIVGILDLYFIGKLFLYKGLILSIIFLVLTTTSSFATVYYVSSSGDDGKTGTSPAEAWRTLEKVNSFSPKPGDQILFNRGDQWVGTLNINASGTSGSQIIYGAYGTGQKPKIYGSEEITGWTLHSGNIYKATFNSTIEQLNVDGVRMTLARYPNSGYTTNSYTSSWDGGRCIGRNSAYTFAHSTVSGTGSLVGAKGYLLTNKLIFLDNAGEWYYDSGTNTIYLWTPSGNSPTNYTIRGSILQYGINLNGQNYVNIESLIITDV